METLQSRLTGLIGKRARLGVEHTGWTMVTIQAVHPPTQLPPDTDPIGFEKAVVQSEFVVNDGRNNQKVLGCYLFIID